jgi:hypothetical protein
VQLLRGLCLESLTLMILTTKIWMTTVSSSLVLVRVMLSQMDLIYLVCWKPLLILPQRGKTGSSPQRSKQKVG